MSNSRVYLEQLGSLIGGTFTAADPISISARVEELDNSLMEIITPTKYSTGWYYVVLTDELYTNEVTYHVRWSVEMVTGFTSTLITRFYYLVSGSVTYNRVQVQNVYLKIRSERYKLYVAERYGLKLRSA